MTAGLEQLKWSSQDKVLIYGIGNVGRQDDGLGIRLIEKLEASGIDEYVTLEANYQLNIEDAWLLSRFDVVLFADASRQTSAAPCDVQAVEPGEQITFTTHAMSASSVLSLCEQLYGRKPRVFMLALPGYEWDISEQLTDKAQHNLDYAYNLLMKEVQCMRSH
jgi:hydrogenase maturation protease